MIDLNIVRREAERVVARRAHGVRVGVVSSYDPATHSVKLTMQPEGYQTGWVPIATMGIGNGFGIFCGPSTGDSVIVAYHESDKKTPIVIGRLPTNEDAPVSAQSGEVVFKSAFGSALQMLKDGSAALTTEKGSQITCSPDGTITMTGVAGQSIFMDTGGNIILTPGSSGKVQVGGSGGVPAARNGDAVSGGEIVASSTKVLMS